MSRSSPWLSFSRRGGGHLGSVAVLAAELWLIAGTLSPLAVAQEVNQQRPFGIRTIAIPTAVQGEQVTSAALSASGLLALATATGRVSIVDADLRAWRGAGDRRIGRGAISSLTFSGDGLALAGVTDGALLVWRLNDPSVTRIPLNVSVKDPPTAIGLSGAARRLAVAHFDVAVFDVEARRIVRKFEQPVGNTGASTYEALAFTSDSKVLVGAGGGNVGAWSVETGEALQHWSCRCGANGVALSRDAALVAFGTADARVLLAEVSSAKLLKRKTVSALRGDHAYGTAVSSKGGLVAVGTASGMVAVWDTKTDTIVGRAWPTRQPIVRITSSDDGRLLLIEGQKAEYVRGSYDRWLATLTQR